MNREIGTTVRFELMLSDNGVPVTGESPTVGIRRCSDNVFFDWFSMTFGGGMLAQPYTAMTEVPLSLGTYQKDFDSSGHIVEPGEYAVHYRWTNGGDNCEVVDQENWTRGDLADKTLVNRMVVDESGSQLIIYEDDGVTPAKTWPLLDKDDNSIVLTGTGPVKRGVPV